MTGETSTMFKKASKSQIKVRLSLSGAAGSGKTFSSLAIASHLSKKIAVIDTERGSASRYADIFNFDVCELTHHHPSKYIEAIETAEHEYYEVIIIDSLTHAWYAELELVEQAKNSFSAWKDVRPLERKLIDTIVKSNAHIIATMRSKTEWDTTSVNGKMQPKKIGTAPIQTSGIEYEFDIAGELSADHILYISKSRCPALQDTNWLKPSKDFAHQLRAWMGEVWLLWKSEEDAISWAATQLPETKPEQLREEFSNLSPSNGKKAPAWVERVMELKEPF
jgi:AAA domain